ncbi:hypothetical protein AAE478_003539 [Parahypoxylon ruwenzoriense]
MALVRQLRHCRIVPTSNVPMAPLVWSHNGSGHDKQSALGSSRSRSMGYKFTPIITTNFVVSLGRNRQETLSLWLENLHLTVERDLWSALTQYVSPLRRELDTRIESNKQEAGAASAGSPHDSSYLASLIKKFLVQFGHNSVFALPYI